MEEQNVVEQLINMLKTPIAKRKGIFIPAEDCEIWSECLNEFLEGENMPDQWRVVFLKVCYFLDKKGLLNEFDWVEIGNEFQTYIKEK